MAAEPVAQQLPLFHTKGQAEKPPLTLASAALTAQTSLTSAIGAFHDFMLRQGFAPNTIKAFGGDLAIFQKYTGAARPVGELSTQHLNEYLTFLREYRGVPCTPKTYQRRLTTLKVFFNFLFRQRAIPKDPTISIAHLPASSPLPDILYPDQASRLLEAAHRMRDAGKSDVRPYLILSLVLATGIKKSELMAMRLADIDLSDPRLPVLYVRYPDPRRRHKERKLKLPPDLPATLALYRQQYQVEDRLFECTPRNLEYVLADLARQAGLSNSVSFETLRWSCAVRDYTQGMREETLRQKLGLSTITWPEVLDKIKRLSAAPL